MLRLEQKESALNLHDETLMSLKSNWTLLNQFYEACQLDQKLKRERGKIIKIKTRQNATITQISRQMNESFIYIPGFCLKLTALLFLLSVRNIKCG